MPKIISFIAVLFVLSAASCCKRSTIQDGSVVIVQVEQVLKNPKKYSSKIILLSGLLKNTGNNYFTDLKLALEGEKGGQIEVTPWAPLGVPPPRPGPNQPRRPKVMSDFLGKKMNLTGRLEDQSGKIILRVEKAEVIFDREEKDAN